MTLCVKPPYLLVINRDWKPRLIWGQVQSSYPHWSKILYNIFRAPESTSGVDRNQKLNKRVFSSLRCRMGEGNVERQASVAHNSQKIVPTFTNRRNHGFEAVISRSSKPQNHSSYSEGRNITDTNQETD